MSADCDRGVNTTVLSVGANAALTCGCEQREQREQSEQQKSAKWPKVMRENRIKLRNTAPVNTGQQKWKLVNSSELS